MADSPIYLLPIAPPLVGTERIPADTSPFGVAGSTCYTTPNAIATFLANNNINGTLTPNYVPYATAPKTLDDSRIFHDANNITLSSPNGYSYLDITNTVNKILMTNNIGSSSLFYQDVSRFILSWNNGVASGDLALEPSAASIGHTSLILFDAPNYVFNNLTPDRILGINGSNQLTTTNLTISQFNNILPVTTVFTANWSTQTLVDVGTLYYFINAGNSTPKTVNLPASPTQSNLVTIKDKKGDAATNNITIQGNGKLIDGVSSILINKNNQSYTLKYDGTDWNII